MRTRTALLSLFVVSLTIRMLPLSFSPLPYNIDGFSLVKVAETIQEDGEWTPIPGLRSIDYNSRLPVYPLYDVALSDAAGIPVLYMVQWLMPLVTSTSVLGVFVLSRRLFGSNTGALFASLFVAVDGPFVFLTSSIMKQALGFVLFPLILYLHVGRSDPRKRALEVLLLLPLFLLHHLTALIVFSIISTHLLLHHVIAFRNGVFSLRRMSVDMLLGPALFIPGLIYYERVRMPYFAEVEEAGQIPLFLSVYFLLSLGGLVMCRAVQARRWRLADVKIAVYFIALSAVTLNYSLTVFAGTSKTSPALLLTLIPYSLLAVMAYWGFNMSRYSAHTSVPMFSAMVLASFSLIAFSILRGLDPLSFTLLYRSFNFLDFPIALGFGLFCAATLRTLRTSRLRTSAFVIATLIMLSGTLPMAYSTVEVFQVQNVTRTDEFSALRFAYDHDLSPLHADQRMGNVFEWYFTDVDADTTLPFRLNEGKVPKGVLLLEQSWTTDGAQEHPLPNIVLRVEDLRSIMSSQNLIYSGGYSSDEIRIVVSS